MMADCLRTGSPGVRLRWALLASLVLHGLMLTPFGHLRDKPVTPVLTVFLMPQPMLEQVQETLRPTAMPEPPPAARPETPPAPLRPQPLAGRELKTALSQMARVEFYPREAIARGLEGRVVLLLATADNGVVSAIEIAASSGHALLDDAALQAAARIGRLPGGRRQVLLPVEFRLE